MKIGLGKYFSGEGGARNFGQTYIGYSKLDVDAIFAQKDSYTSFRLGFQVEGLDEGKLFNAGAFVYQNK